MTPWKGWTFKGLVDPVSHPAASGQESSGDSRWWKIPLGVVAALFWVWFFWPSDTSYNECKDNIRAFFNNSHSVEFLEHTKYTWKSNGKVSRIEVKVRVNQSFGGPIIGTTLDTTCHYDHDGVYQYLY